MSRNNKNARLHAEARAWSKIRKDGGSGPSKTQAKHEKENVKWKSKEVSAARIAVLRKVEAKTVLEQLKGTQE